MKRKSIAILKKIPTYDWKFLEKIIMFFYPTHKKITTDGTLYWKERNKIIYITKFEPVI